MPLLNEDGLLALHTHPPGPRPRPRVDPGPLPDPEVVKMALTSEEVERIRCGQQRFILTPNMELRDSDRFSWLADIHNGTRGLRLDLYVYRANDLLVDVTHVMKAETIGGQRFFGWVLIDVLVVQDGG